jgi:hypothetical protein
LTTATGKETGRTGNKAPKLKDDRHVITAVSKVSLEPTKSKEQERCRNEGEPQSLFHPVIVSGVQGTHDGLNGVYSCQQDRLLHGKPVFQHLTGLFFLQCTSKGIWFFCPRQQPAVALACGKPCDCDLPHQVTTWKVQNDKQKLKTQASVKCQQMVCVCVCVCVFVCV